MQQALDQDRVLKLNFNARQPWKRKDREIAALAALGRAAGGRGVQLKSLKRVRAPAALRLPTAAAPSCSGESQAGAVQRLRAELKSRQRDAPMPFFCYSWRARQNSNSKQPIYERSKAIWHCEVRGHCGESAGFKRLSTCQTAEPAHPFSLMRQGPKPGELPLSFFPEPSWWGARVASSRVFDADAGGL